MRLGLSFYIDLNSGFQFNGAVVIPDCNLLKPAFIPIYKNKKPYEIMNTSNAGSVPI